MIQLVIFLVLLFLALIIFVRGFQNWIFGEDDPGDKGFPITRRKKK